jgi:hypothetical protein
MKLSEYTIRQISKLSYILGQEPSKLSYILGHNYRTFWGFNTVSFGADEIFNNLYISYLQMNFLLIIILIKDLIIFNHIETAPKNFGFLGLFLLPGGLTYDNVVTSTL